MRRGRRGGRKEGKLKEDALENSGVASFPANIMAAK